MQYTHEVHGTIDGEVVTVPAFYPGACPADASEAVDPGAYGTDTQPGEPHVCTVCPECIDDWSDYEFERDADGQPIFRERSTSA